MHNWPVEELECVTFDVSWTLVKEVVTRKILNDVMLIWLSHPPGAGRTPADAGFRPRSTWSWVLASSLQLFWSFIDIAYISVKILLVHKISSSIIFEYQYQLRDSLINLFDLNVLREIWLLMHNVRTSFDPDPGRPTAQTTPPGTSRKYACGLINTVNPFYYVWGISPTVLSSFHVYTGWYAISDYLRMRMNLIRVLRSTLCT